MCVCVCVCVCVLEEEEKEEEEEEEEGHEEELGVKGRKLTYEEKQDPNYSAIVKFLSVLVVEDDHHTACVHDSCLQIAGRRSVVISATKQTTPFTGVCHPIVGVVFVHVDAELLTKFMAYNPDSDDEWWTKSDTVGEEEDSRTLGETQEKKKRKKRRKKITSVLAVEKV